MVKRVNGEKGEKGENCRIVEFAHFHIVEFSH